jgi:hypothetical protein
VADQLKGVAFGIAKEDGLGAHRGKLRRRRHQAEVGEALQFAAKVRFVDFEGNVVER